MTVFDGNLNIKEDLGFNDYPVDGVVTPNQNIESDPLFDMQLIQALGGTGSGYTPSMFANNQSPVNPNQSPTYNPLQSMADASPLTKLIKGLFGVDQFTGSFELGQGNDPDPHGDENAIMANAMAMMGAGQTPMPKPILTPTEPQPSPNPEGLYIRPNMLNQVPDSYSQAFKDANQSYMQNVAVRPSDFKEKMDLRGFEQLKGLLGE